MDYKVVLGILAVAIGLIAYVPYFVNIIKKRTKPHAFSWFVWGLLEGIVFVAQITHGAGAGSWVTGVTSLFCFLIAGFAFFGRDKDIKKFDWFCLIGAILGIIFWIITKNALIAVIIVTFVDAFGGYAPTFRKAYYKPHEETATTFFLSAVKVAVNLFALEAYSLTTVLYPASLVVTNSLFVSMLLIRRRVLKDKSVV